MEERANRGRDAKRQYSSVSTRSDPLHPPSIGKSTENDTEYTKYSIQEKDATIKQQANRIDLAVDWWRRKRENDADILCTTTNKNTQQQHENVPHLERTEVSILYPDVSGVKESVERGIDSRRVWASSGELSGAVQWYEERGVEERQTLD